MLRQAAVLEVFLFLRGLFSLGDKEKKTDMEKQDLDSRNVDGENDRLKVKWFSEIPHCSFQCLYPPALDCGCGHLDFNCICRSIPDIAADEDVEACVKSCPVNPDKISAPSRILDFCDLVGEYIELPEYMAQFARLHRRQNEQVSYSDGDYYSTASYSDGGYYSIASYSDLGSSQQLTTTTSDIQASATSTAATGSEKTESTPTPTTTGSAPTHTVPPSPSSGLSTGAKAGLGVAIPLVVIIICSSLFWYFRKRKANRRNDVRGNSPEISEQPWPEKTMPESRNLPAEADSTALHEPDSNFVFESPSLAASAENPGVYELSGNSAVERPPAAGFATQKHKTSRGYHSSNTHSTMSKDVLRKTVTSSASAPASETISNGGSDASISALAHSGISSQNPQVNTLKGAEQLSSSVESTDAQLMQLEAEMSRITEERERLQQMQVLADREAELKKQIAARKAANLEARGNSDSSP